MPRTEEEDLPKVIDLAARRLLRTPHVAVEADTEAGFVVLSWVHPDHGNVSALLGLEDVNKAIEGLIRAGSTLAQHRYALWAAHIAFAAGNPEGARGRAEAFIRLWRKSRPDPFMVPSASRTVVHEAATELALGITGGAQGTPSWFSEVQSMLAHLGYDGEPLEATEARCGHPGHDLLPWDCL
jgi:hypothetical protein